jgi:hypothetical protein
MSMKGLRRGGTCCSVLLLSKIVRGLVWAEGRIMYGIDRGFDGNGASCKLEWASQCIGPGSQLTPQNRGLGS